jgi:hypothetical protein
MTPWYPELDWSVQKMLACVFWTEQSSQESHEATRQTDVWSVGARHRRLVGHRRGVRAPGGRHGINVVLLARGEERLKDVAVSLTARYHIDTRTVAVDRALTALLENKPSTITRTDLAAQYEDLRTAAGEAIKARLAARQPSH